MGIGDPRAAVRALIGTAIAALLLLAASNALAQRTPPWVSDRPELLERFTAMHDEDMDDAGDRL